MPGAGGSVPAKVAEAPRAGAAGDRARKRGARCTASALPPERSLGGRPRGLARAARRRRRVTEHAHARRCWRACRLAAPRAAHGRWREAGRAPRSPPRAFNRASTLSGGGRRLRQRSEPRPRGPRGGPGGRGERRGHGKGPRPVTRSWASRVLRSAPCPMLGGREGLRGRARCPAAGAYAPQAGAQAGASRCLFGAVVTHQEEPLHGGAPARRDACTAQAPWSTRGRVARSVTRRPSPRRFTKGWPWVRTAGSSTAAGGAACSRRTPFEEGLSSAFWSMKRRLPSVAFGPAIVDRVLHLR